MTESYDEYADDYEDDYEAGYPEAEYTYEGPETDDNGALVVDDEVYDLLAETVENRNHAELVEAHGDALADNAVAFQEAIGRPLSQREIEVIAYGAEQTGSADVHAIYTHFIGDLPDLSNDEDRVYLLADYMEGD